MKINSSEMTKNMNNCNDNWGVDIDEFVASLPPAQQRLHQYCTEDLHNDRGRQLALSQGLLTPDFLNGQCIGSEFWCIGFYTDYVEVCGDVKLRCILMDEAYQTYSTVSAGIAKVVKSWIDAGIIPTVDDPIYVQYLQQRNGMMQYYTLRIINK